MKFSSLISIFLGGALFGFGLTWAGMTKPEVVLSFLRFEDFGLMLVLGSATFTTAVVYQLAPRLMGKPLLEKSFGSHFSGDMKPTLIGAAIFGIGWGISGVCPGPAVAGLGMGSWNLLVAVAAMFAGAWCHGLYMSRRDVADTST
jgi:uncharacterized membrane protein YedE/YeeE